MPQRAALYARVSTVEQAQAGSVQPRLEACRSYRAAQRWAFVAEEVSDTIPLQVRPAGARLVADSGAGCFDVVVVSYLAHAPN